MSWRFAKPVDCPSCSEEGHTVAMAGPLALMRTEEFFEDIYACPFCGAFAVYNRQSRKLHLHKRGRGVYIDPRTQVD
jgi:hypothetical protein